MFSGKGSWYTLVDLSALITRLHNFYHHCGLSATLWLLLVVSESSWLQWPGRGKDAPSPCPGSGQVEQILPGRSMGNKVQNRASHPGESSEIEFVEKTGQTQDLVWQVYWSACFHATIPDYSFFLNIPQYASDSDKMAPIRSPASLKESDSPGDINPFQSAGWSRELFPSVWWVALLDMMAVGSLWWPWMDPGQGPQAIHQVIWIIHTSFFSMCFFPLCVETSQVIMYPNV